MISQLAFELTPFADRTFSNFISGENQALLVALKRLIAGQGERFIYCCGSHGVGRTHLLQACCHALHDEPVMYLPAAAPGIVSDMLQGLEYMHLVCIDDIDCVMGDSEWEEALFHFYNRAIDSGIRLVVAATKSPTQLDCLLPDLRSRLAWGPVFNVTELNDEDKIKALQLRALERGFEISKEVGDFLLRYCPRDMLALFKLLDQLDQASLAEQRKLTIPFVKSIIIQSEDTVC